MFIILLFLLIWHDWGRGSCLKFTLKITPIWRKRNVKKINEVLCYGAWNLYLQYYDSKTKVLTPSIRRWPFFIQCIYISIRLNAYRGLKEAGSLICKRFFCFFILCLFWTCYKVFMLFYFSLTKIWWVNLTWVIKKLFIFLFGQ